MTNNRERNEQLRSAALIALATYGYENYELTDGEARRLALREMARAVVAATGCTPESARRHIAAAIRRERGETLSPEWGGYRPGAGRPPETKE